MLIEVDANVYLPFLFFRTLTGKQVMVHDKYVAHRTGVRMLSQVIIYGFQRHFPVRLVT